MTGICQAEVNRWFTPERYLIMLIWHIFPSSSINVILICNYVSTNALLREIDIIQIVVIFPNCFLNWFSSQYSKNEIFKAQNIPSHEHLVDLGPCQPYLVPFPVTCWFFGVSYFFINKVNVVTFILFFLNAKYSTRKVFREHSNN